MTLAPADLEQPAQLPVQSRSPRRLRFPFWGWLPPVLTTAVGARVLAFYDVPLPDLAAFGAYLLLVIMLPGTLLWRALCGGSKGLVLDVAAGSALGYALEVLAYIGARWADRPRLALVVPAAIVVSFVAVPRLWRFWRGSGERVPVWWAWLLSVSAAFLLAFSAAQFYRSHGLDWPGSGKPYLDLPFHLALAGEVRHHMPPVIPYVRGESLNYHWFLYADLAAVNSATGIELQTLLVRLSMLPVLVLCAVLTAVTAVRITGRWWTGPVAVAVTLVAVSPSPYARGLDPVSSGLALPSAWLSPTQTFGAAIFAGTILLLVDLLRRPAVGWRWGRWVVLAILLVVLAGAKATFLPMLLCGLLIVVVGRLIAAREVNWPGLAAFGMTALTLALAQVLMYAGFSGGLSMESLAGLQYSAIATQTGLGPALVVGEIPPTATVLGITLFCWAATWAGALGLLAKWRRILDAELLLLIGVAAAGIGATMTFVQPGASQWYFFQSTRSVLGLLFAIGLAAVLPRRGALPRGASPARIALLLAGAAAAGAATVWALASIDGTLPTVDEHGWDVGFALRLALPYFVILAAAGLVFATLRLAGRRWVVGAAGAAAAALVFLAAGGVVPMVTGRLEPTFRLAITDGWQVEPAPAANGRIWTVIPAGAIEVGRWVRGHSDPDDLVATNVHCMPGPLGRPCQNRHFWVAAYTERRVLVEGWGYTRTSHERAKATGLPHELVPFWDSPLLAANDEAFAEPSRESIGRLRDEYGVRWLVVDRRYNPPAADLSSFADLRVRVDDTVVYVVTR
jgi:hypothetical protein